MSAALPVQALGPGRGSRHESLDLVRPALGLISASKSLGHQPSALARTRRPGLPVGLKSLSSGLDIAEGRRYQVRRGLYKDRENDYCLGKVRSGDFNVVKNNNFISVKKDKNFRELLMEFLLCEEIL